MSGSPRAAVAAAGPHGMAEAGRVASVAARLDDFRGVIAHRLTRWSTGLWNERRTAGPRPIHPLAHSPVDVATPTPVPAVLAGHRPLVDELAWRDPVGLEDQTQHVVNLALRCLQAGFDGGADVLDNHAALAGRGGNGGEPLVSH